MAYDDYLKHYGVLGMKWGISRSKEVRGAKKEYKKRMKEFNSEVGRFGKSLTDGYNSHRAQRKLAIKEAKRSGDKAQVKRVKEHFKNEYKRLDQRNKEEGARLLKKENDLKAGLKDAKERAADRLFGDGSSARNKRIANASLGKVVLQSMLMGSYGAKKYNQYRSEGKNRGDSYVRGYFDNIENASTGGKRDYLSSKAARSIRKKKEQQSKRK